MGFEVSSVGVAKLNSITEDVPLYLRITIFETSECTPEYRWMR